MLFLSRSFSHALDLEKHSEWVSNGRFSPRFSTANWSSLPSYWYPSFRPWCKWRNRETLCDLLLSFSWQKFFKSRIAKAFNAGAKYYFNFIICIFGLLFLGKRRCVHPNEDRLFPPLLSSVDSIREVRKYSGYENKDLSTPHAEVHAHMKQFRSQRNFYIAGFALFLWL